MINFSFCGSGQAVLEFFVNFGCVKQIVYYLYGSASGWMP